MIATTAKIRIKCDDTLEGVARRLQTALSLPAFWFDSDMDPPHAVTAMTECVGYELWLRADGSAFEFTVEASMDIRDRAEGCLVDISEWFSKQVGTVSDLSCSPVQVSIP